MVSNPQRSGLFTETERRLIDAYTDLSGEERRKALSEISEKDVKHRLKNKKTTPKRLLTVMNTICEDLERLEHYFFQVEGNPEKFQFIQQELDNEDIPHRLTRLFQTWEQQATGSPLPLDLPEATEPLFSKLEDVPVTERKEEYSSRLQATLWILRRENPTGIVDLLRFIRDHDRREQQNKQHVMKDNSIQGRSWLWYGPRWLGASGHGLITEHEHSGNRKAFELTDRGIAVLETLESVVESTVVERRSEREDESIFESAEAVLTEYN